MSTASRLTTYRTDSDSILLRSGPGSFSPISSCLDIGSVSSDFKSASDASRVSATLLHERHHWLQHVGTTGGAYNYLLLQLQAGIVRNLSFKSLNESDLPLLTSTRDESHRPIATFWEMLELTRRRLFGCRVGDYYEIEAAVEVDYDLISQILQRHLSQNIPGSDGKNLELTAWAALRGKKISPSLLVQHNGWILGARHLMESSARTGEMLKLALDNRVFNGQLVFDARELGTGIYGVAADVFHRACGLDTWSVTSEIVLSTLCDIVLNAMFPPAVPPLPLAPGALFVDLARTIKGFDFSQQVPVNDPSAVRDLIEQVYEHISARTPLDGSIITKRVVDMFHHLNPEEAKGSLYVEDPTTKYPVATKHNVLLPFHAALWGESAKIRSEAPEFFVFPICVYRQSRANFHMYFDRIAPPLLTRNGAFYPATEGTWNFEWLAFFVSVAITADIYRGLIYLNLEELARVLSRYARLPLDDDASRHLLFQSIYNATDGGPLGVSLIRSVSGLLRCESPL